MVLGKKSLKTVIHTLVSLNAMSFKAMGFLKITSKKTGSVDILKKATSLICFNTIMKVVKKSLIKYLKDIIKKEATGSIMTFSFLIGIFLMTKLPKLLTQNPTLK